MKSIINAPIGLLLIIFILLFACETPHETIYFVSREEVNDQLISRYTMALENNPKDTDAYMNRGVVYGNKGQYDLAISDLNKAIEINPKFSSAYYNRARSYYFKKKYDYSWEDVTAAHNFGFKVPTEFLEELRKASGRQN